MALYEVLIDDDEEIRETGARVVSQLVGESFSPYMAAREFVSWLVLVGCESDIGLPLSYYATLRLTGQLHEAENAVEILANDIFNLEVKKNLPEHCFPHVEGLLATALKDNNDLFAREKQNLYVDEAREAEVWSNFLISLGKEMASVKALLIELVVWVAHGEQVLHLTKDDESLEKTRKPAVYTIRKRVMYGSKVVKSLGY
jgi:hypothetical protein